MLWRKGRHPTSRIPHRERLAVAAAAGRCRCHRPRCALCSRRVPLRAPRLLRTCLQPVCARSTHGVTLHADHECCLLSWKSVRVGPAFCQATHARETAASNRDAAAPGARDCGRRNGPRLERASHLSGGRRRGLFAASWGHLSARPPWPQQCHLTASNTPGNIAPHVREQTLPSVPTTPASHAPNWPASVQGRGRRSSQDRPRRAPPASSRQNYLGTSHITPPSRPDAWVSGGARAGPFLQSTWE